MSDTTDQPGGGLLGKLKGKAKEVGGEIVGNDELAAEGRLEQATVEAATEAEQRDRAAAVAAEQAAGGGRRGRARGGRRGRLPPRPSSAPGRPRWPPSRPTSRARSSATRSRPSA